MTALSEVAGPRTAADRCATPRRCLARCCPTPTSTVDDVDGPGLPVVAGSARALDSLDSDIAAARRRVRALPRDTPGRGRAYNALGTLAEGYEELEESLQGHGDPGGHRCRGQRRGVISRGRRAARRACGGTCDERAQRHELARRARTPRRLARDGIRADLVPAPGLSRRCSAPDRRGRARRWGAERRAQAALAQSAEACIKARKKENQAVLRNACAAPIATTRKPRSQYDKAAAASRREATPRRRRRPRGSSCPRPWAPCRARSTACRSATPRTPRSRTTRSSTARSSDPRSRGRPTTFPARPPMSVSTDGTCPGETFACPGQDGRCCYNGTFCCPCACCIYNDCRCCVGA